MPIVPMKQVVTVKRPGVKDEWGEGGKDRTFSLKCRITEGGKLDRVSNASSGISGVVSEEVVSVATILFDKLADIRYEDTISFRNELGVTVHYKPLNIKIVRNVAGKPILTKVSV